jgi:hypothetical protein
MLGLISFQVGLVTADKCSALQLLHTFENPTVPETDKNENRKFSRKLHVTGYQGGWDAESLFQYDLSAVNVENLTTQHKH